MITVTLQQIKDAHPCECGWKKVLKANGGVNADMHKPIPLISILDSNGLNDTLWVIPNIPEMSEHDDVWRKFSSWCALQNIEKISKYCTTEDYRLIVKWLETNDLDLREPAASAAYAAAESASAASASAAAASAAYAAAASAAAASAAYAAAASASAASASAASASAAAASAAYAAAAAASAAYAAAESAQGNKLREILELA